MRVEVGRSAARWAVAAAFLAGTASASELVVERVGRTSQGYAYVSFRLDRPFQGKALEGIRSGLPCTITFTVEIWRRRSGWWDRLEETRESQLRVLRDLLDQEYLLVTGEEVRRFPDLEALTAAACANRREYFRPQDAGRTYYVAITANVAPLSVEDLRELEEWLQGTLRTGERSPREGVAGLSGTLVGMLLSWTGFGDENVRGRSARFVPGALPLDAAPETPRAAGAPDSASSQEP